MTDEDRLSPVIAGIVSVIVGFSSSFAVVLAGLRAVGADQDQAASGLFALCVGCGVVAITLGLRFRMPISIAWSTPGAALLVSAGHVDGSFAAAVGAFLVSGVLLTLAGVWKRLGRWIAAIPGSIAAAMLAGVLLPLCLAPVHAVVELPGRAAPIVVVWALCARFAKRWAIPAALVVAVVMIAATEHVHLGGSAAPTLTLVAPSFHAGALIGIAIPLFIVTMASQNIPGMAVMATYGYQPDLSPLLRATGIASVLTAPFGAHAINLAAIMAALGASPDAHPDPRRRWIATVTGGIAFCLIGLGAAFAAAFVAAAPPLLIEAVAGLALLGALGAALSGAMASTEHREAATITFVVSASGISALSIGGAFWGLVAGLAFLASQNPRLLSGFASLGRIRNT